jgi:hypothetical protein
MDVNLRKAFEAEMAEAKRRFLAGAFERAFHHLERAHVLGQRFVVPHGRCHWLFLRVGWARRSWPEVRGQVIRLILGTIGSMVGRVPIGNTGGTNIGMFERRNLVVKSGIVAVVDREDQERGDEHSGEMADGQGFVPGESALLGYPDHRGRSQNAEQGRRRIEADRGPSQDGLHSMDSMIMLRLRSAHMAGMLIGFRLGTQEDLACHHGRGHGRQGHESANLMGSQQVSPQIHLLLP